MNEAASNSTFDQLRRRAEELLQECSGDKRAGKPGTHILTIIDELETRQAELQTQLDELLKARRVLEDSCKRLEDEVKAGNDRLQEAHAALKALMRQVQEERTELEESLLNNVQHLIMPCLARLKKNSVAQTHGRWLEMIESHLLQITSRFVHKISSPMLGLSPSEIRVADLIRRQKSSKQIADLLGLSERAVVFHRQSIRRKLGLTGSKLNLQTYIHNLD